MITSDENTESQSDSSMCLFADRKDVVQYVDDLLKSWEDSHMSTIIIRPVRSEEFYVGTVTTGSLADILLQNCFGQQRII